jgi:hypothetical protein
VNPVVYESDNYGGIYLVLFLLLDGRDGPPGSAARAHRVLVGDTQQVAFLVRQFLAGLHIQIRVIYDDKWQANIEDNLTSKLTRETSFM